MKITKGIIAVTMAILMIAITPMSVYAARTYYVKELLVAYGSTEEEAKKNLTDKGYIAINGNLNKDADGSVVMMGYKKTSNKDEAITDLRVMDMEGGYSYGEYDAMIERLKTNVNEEVEGLMCAVETFKANYDAGKPNALYAKEKLDEFVEDDSALGLGEFILQNVDNKDNLNKISLQGNKYAVSTLRYYLGVGCAENWIDNLDNSGSLDAIEIDNRAENLYNVLEAFQNEIRKYEGIVARIKESGMTEEEYLKSVDESYSATYLSYIATYEIINKTKVNGVALYDILMKDLNELDKPELYPIVSAFSAPIAAVLSYTGLNPIIYIALNSDEQWNKLYEEEKTNTPTEKISVYSGVDRSLFTDSGIALTTAALREQASSGKSFFEDSTDKAVFISIITCFGVGLIGTIIGVWATKSLETIAEGFAGELGTAWMHQTGYVVFIAQEQQIDQVLAAKFFKFAGYAKAFEYVCIGLMLIAVAAILGYTIYKSKHPKYTTIPRVIVDEAIVNGVSKYKAYYSVKNTNGDAADINNWSAKKWTAVYYTKDKEAGSPITITSLVQFNNSTKDGYSGLCKFGETAAFDLNSFSMNSTDTQVYFLFKRDASSLSTATSFSQGYLALAGALGLVVGSVLTFVTTKGVSKKKDKEKAEA